MCCWKHWRNKESDTVVYPKDIVPQPQYVIKIDIDNLLDKIGDFLICRRLNGSLDDNIIEFNGRKKLTIEALGDIINLSTNMLGAKFRTDKHLMYSPKGDATNDWDGKPVDLSKYNESYTIVENYSFVTYKGKGLHNHDFPYWKALSKDDIKKAESLGIDLGKLNELSEAQFTGKIRLEHKPTMLNYWHVVMDLYPQDSEDPLVDKKARWKKNMARFVLEKILTIDFEIEIESIPSISKKNYIK